MNKQPNNGTTKQHSPVIRIISSVVLASFVWTFILFEPVHGITTYVQDINKIRDVINKLDEFVLPYKYGRIVE
jgi:hypothetical protein